MNGPPTLYLADAIADDRGVLAAPGAILTRDANRPPAVEILCSGPSAVVLKHPLAADAKTVELPDCLLTPAMVNAHSHLDLTSVGPRPFDPGADFAQWLGEIRRDRPVAENAIRESVRRGVELSLRGGVVAVGDIAGAWSLIPCDELRRSRMRGVSFVECFGLGRATEAIERVQQAVDSVNATSDGVRLGLQPHAPFSAGLSLYEHAASVGAERGLPLATHLAESRAERDLVVRRSGPIRDFLESLGLWTDAAAADFGRAASPVSHLRSILHRAPWLVAHVNDCSDDDMEILRDAGAAAVYCPRASAYFRHEHDLGPHRYRDMLKAGVPVALGTDSIVCLPAHESDRLSVLDDMRFLYQRDGADPALLLRMATTNGAAALGLPPEEFRLSVGATAGLLAIPLGVDHRDDPLRAALKGDGAPKLLTDESGSRQTATHPL